MEKKVPILPAAAFALALLAAPIAVFAAGEKEGGASQKPLDCSTCVGAECVKLQCLEKGGNLTISPCNRFDPACSGEGGYTDVNEPWGQHGSGGGGSDDPPSEGEETPSRPSSPREIDLAECIRRQASGSEECMKIATASQWGSEICAARGSRLSFTYDQDGYRQISCTNGDLLCVGFGDTSEVFVCDRGQADAPLDPFAGGRPESLGGAEPDARGVECGPGEEERVVRVRDRRGGELRERTTVRCVDPLRRPQSIERYGAASPEREPKRDETRRTRDYRKGAADEDGEPAVRTHRTRDYRKQPEVEPEWPTVQ